MHWNKVAEELERWAARCPDDPGETFYIPGADQAKIARLRAAGFARSIAGFLPQFVAQRIVPQQSSDAYYLGQWLSAAAALATAKCKAPNATDRPVEESTADQAIEWLLLSTSPDKD